MTSYPQVFIFSLLVSSYDKESAKGSIWQGGESFQMVLKKVKWTYAKQCEIMQIDEKAQTTKFTVFARGSQLRGVKNMEN